jgi:hypothetical protein
MNKLTVFFIGSLAITTLSGGLPYLLEQRWIEAVIIFMLGLTWGYANRREAAIGSIAFLLFVAVSVIGILMGLYPAAMVVCITAALATLDLDDFERQMRNSQEDQTTTLIQRFHVRALVTVIGIGLFIGVLATITFIRMSFWPLSVLALLMTIALSRVFQKLNQVKRS